MLWWTGLNKTFQGREFLSSQTTGLEVKDRSMIIELLIAAWGFREENCAKRYKILKKKAESWKVTAQQHQGWISRSSGHHPAGASRAWCVLSRTASLKCLSLHWVKANKSLPWTPELCISSLQNLFVHGKKFILYFYLPIMPLVLEMRHRPNVPDQLSSVRALRLSKLSWSCVLIPKQPISLCKSMLANMQKWPQVDPRARKEKPITGTLYSSWRRTPNTAEPYLY